jgi:hypothetical protein
MAGNALDSADLRIRRIVVMDTPEIRNSQILGVLIEIIQGPIGRLQAVETAGRGIAAEARCTLSVLADKGVQSAHVTDETLASVNRYAERLFAFGVIEDDLSRLWLERRGERIDDARFELELQEIVARLEAWPMTHG